MKKYNFKFAGVALSDFYGVTTTRPPREVAQYDFTLLDIPGRSGSEYIDNKRYKNVPLTREIGFAQHTYAYVDNLVEKVINWLAYLQGYQEFEDSDHPDMVTYAVLTNFSEVQTVLRRHHRATLKFSRVPFWYEKKGLVAKSASNLLSGVTLNNRYPIISKPIIEVVLQTSISNSNSFTLRFNGTDYLYKMSALPYHTGSQVRKYMFFDFENEEIRMSTAESGGNVKYADADMPEGFVPGENSVCIYAGYSNTVANLYVTPRWRCL